MLIHAMNIVDGGVSAIDSMAIMAEQKTVRECEPERAHQRTETGATVFAGGPVGVRARGRLG